MNKVRIIVIFVMLVLIGAGIFWFVDYSSKNQPLVIKIGGLMPSATGDLVANREQMMNGMELAKEYLTKKYKGRVIIEIDYEDGCFVRETVPAVQKFIHDGVSIIGASFCLFGHLPILPMTEGNKIITFNTAANPDKALNLNYAFSTNVEVKDEGKKLSEFAYNTLGARRAVIMFLDTPFGYDYAKSFNRDFTERGGVVAAYFPNAPDGKKFDVMIQQIKAQNPDVIVTAHFGLPLAMFIHGVRKAGINVPILGNYETEDPTVVTYAGASAEGVIFSSSELAEKTPAMINFENKYIRKFGIRPGVLAANCYDDIVLSVEAYIRCNGDRDCMAAELHSISSYDGASGVITIKQSGAASKPTIFKIIKNRTFIRYQE